MSQALRIQPADKTFFAGAESVRDVAVKLRTGTVVVADRINPDNTVTRVLLVTNERKNMTVGHVYDDVRHATNNRPYGPHQVLDVVHFKFRDGLMVVSDLAIASAEFSLVADQTGALFSMF